jgi:hypothetical protein
MPGGYWGDVLAHLSIELLANFVLFAVFLVMNRGGLSWKPRSLRRFDLICRHNVHRAIGIASVFAMDVALAMFTVRLVG